jgi:septal ring factor EnvC (AmiA/AmiB activator)
MGFGSTAKKLQQVADMAEDVYGRLNQLRDQVHEMQQTVIETRDRVDDLDRELAEQRAILEALAEKEDVDVAAITADVHVVDAEAVAGDDAAESEGSTD